MALHQTVRSVALVLVYLISCGFRIQAEAHALRSPVDENARILQAHTSSTNSSSMDGNEEVSGSSDTTQVYNHNDDPMQYSPSDGDTPTAMIIILAVVGAVVLTAIVGVAFIKRHHRRDLDRMSSCAPGMDSVEEIHYWRH